MLNFPIPEFSTKDSGYSEILNNFIFQLSAADVDSYTSDKSARFNPLRCTNKDCNLILTPSLINNDNQTCHICQNKLPLNPKNLVSPVNKVLCNILEIQKSIENYIIICFDTSASMNKQYPGKNPLKCRYQIFLDKLFEALSELEKTSNLKYHLFLITFNDKVTLYGDLVSMPPIEIKTSPNISKMVKEASELSPALCKATLKDSLKFLPTLMNDKNNGLYSETFCQGETALGDALAVSLGVVKGFKSDHTQTIILTDGYCNTGLLNMDFLRNPDKNKDLAGEIEKNLIKELEEIAEIAFSLNTCFQIFGFEDEEIFLCYLRKIIEYNQQGEGIMYKIPIDKDGANENDFLNELRRCLKIFESKIGVNANLKIVTNNNVQIKKRQKTLVNASNLKENNYILDLHLGVLSNKNIFSFRYEFLDLKDNCNNIFFHSELEFEQRGRKITLLYEKKIFKMEENIHLPFKLLNDENITQIDMVFKDQILFKEQDKLEKYLMFLYEIEIYFKNNNLKLTNINLLTRLRVELLTNYEKKLIKKDILDKATLNMLKREERSRKNNNIHDSDFATKKYDDIEENKEQVEKNVAIPRFLKKNEDSKPDLTDNFKIDKPKNIDGKSSLIKNSFIVMNNDDSDEDEEITIKKNKGIEVKKDDEITRKKNKGIH